MANEDKSKVAGPTDPPAAAAQAARRVPQHGVIRVEAAASELCRNFLWGPTQSPLRGRWDAHYLPRGDMSEAGVTTIPVIPGQVVTIDPRNRRCAVTDPLADAGNQSLATEVFSRINAVLKESRCPVPPTVRENCDDAELATWTYWAMRLVQAGNGRVIEGEIPRDREHVRAMYPGVRISRKFFDAATQTAAESMMAAAAEGRGGYAPGGGDE